MFKKKYPGYIYKEKYKRYKIVYFLMLGMCIVSFVAFCFVFFNKTSDAKDFESYTGSISFEIVLRASWAIFKRRFLVIMILMLSGITVYAPIVGFAGAVIWGGWCGIDLISYPFASETAGLITVTAFSSLMFIFAYCVYSSFCVCVSFRLFTDKLYITDRNVDEEGRMFGGVLFNSVLFRNTVNIRFLASYILSFLLLSLFVFSVCVIDSYLILLLS